MSSYLGKHAELYDIIYAEKDYSAEARFVDEQLRRHRRGSIVRMLELACGTGRHAIALEALGYSVVATDHSEDMLRVARARAAVTKSQVQFRQADMRQLGPDFAGFDAAICLFDSIGYVQTNEAIEATLSGVVRALRPGGVFLCEFWHAGAMLKSFEPVRVRRWKTPSGELLRVTETQVDCERQLATVNYELLELRADGMCSRTLETQVNRFFLVQEMRSFLVRSGLEPIRFLAGFTDSENIDVQTWHVIAIACRL
jgi:SAM-dependent methyltransferase